MKLLVPVNGSKSSLAAVRHAIGLVNGTQGEVILVNAQPKLPAHIARFTSRASRDALRAERAARALAGARALLESAGIRYEVVAAKGSIAQAVAEASTRFHVDQVIVGATRRASWWQAMFSPVPRIIDLVSVPVSVIGSGRSGSFERLGVPACVGLGLTALVIATE